MRTTAALLALLLALPVAAQTAKPAAPPPPAPVKPAAAVPAITDAQKAAYWKALANQQADSKNWEIRAKFLQDELNKTIASMTDICGKDFALQGSPTGDPVCVLKPAPAEKK